MLLGRDVRKRMSMRHSSWKFITFRSVVVLASAATFAASLTRIAIVADGSDRSVDQLPFYGIGLLIDGGFGMFDDYLNLLMWPLVVVTWMLACRKRFAAAVIAALVAGALAWGYQGR